MLVIEMVLFLVDPLFSVIVSKIVALMEPVMLRSRLFERMVLASGCWDAACKSGSSNTNSIIFLFMSFIF